MITGAGRQILDKQQKLQARQELQGHLELVALLQARLNDYQPGTPSGLENLIELFLTHPLQAPHWRQLARSGQILLRRDRAGAALASEVDTFLAQVAELLIPVEIKPPPPYRDYSHQARQAASLVCPQDTGFGGARSAIRVDPHLWRSPQPSQEDLAHLQERGLKLVVNLREENPVSHTHCGQLGLDYHYLPVPDQKVPRLDQVLEFLRVVQERGPALVHCWAGRGRTGIFVACYRIWRGVEPEQALGQTDSEGLNRGMRDHQREWVRAHALSILSHPADPGHRHRTLD